MGRRASRLSRALEARLPGASMRPASLLLVLVLAKIIELAGHRVDLAWWAPFAYLWHDAAVVLVAAGLDLALARSTRMAWMAYGAIVLYVAINIPVTRALST